MDNDATGTASASPDPKGTPEEGSPETTSTDSAELVASYKRRQAGAEAARQVAEQKLKDAEKALSAYRAKDQTVAETEAGELATLKANLATANERAAAAEAKADARILDARFPNARKELPEVTDEVKLAKFEAMLKEDETPEPPTPRSNNAPRTASGGGAAAKPKTSDDVLAELKLQGNPWYSG